MKIALIQSELFWENTELNIQMFNEKINSIKENIDLIILPEMFTTGFTMNPKIVAETMEGKSIKWMIQKAIELKTAIVGSLVIKEKDSFYNRLVFVYPNGELGIYDKRHLFTLAGEEKVYQRNQGAKLIIDYKGWKICPLICYDLRFPVYSRNTENYDLLIYVANWPERRINAWDALLKARAIENMSFTIGVNRTGTDENENVYNGHSQVVDFLGNYLQPPYSKDEIKIIELNKTDQENTRTKLNFLNDQDEFKLFFD